MAARYEIKEKKEDGGFNNVDLKMSSACSAHVWTYAFFSPFSAFSFFLLLDSESAWSRAL